MMGDACKAGGIPTILKDNKSRQRLSHVTLFIVSALFFGIAIASNTEYTRRGQGDADMILSCGIQPLLKESSKDQSPSRNGNSCPHQSYSMGFIANVTNQKYRLLGITKCCLV